MSYKLLDTSALVLLCDQGVNYQTPLSKKFLSHLDTSAGEIIFNSYSDYFPEIFRIIQNRKYIIHNWCSQFLKIHGPCSQLIFLACGWDPVLIKMQELFPKNKIFGVDNTVQKQIEFTEQIYPNSFISYIQSSIQDSNLSQKLIQKGWDSSQPTALIVEGITYYIPPSNFWHSLSNLKKAISSSSFICGDFLLSPNYLSKKSLKISQLIFETIKEKCQIENYYSYSPKEIQTRGSELGFSSISFVNFEDIEKQRFKVCKNWNEKDCYLGFFCSSL